MDIFTRSLFPIEYAGSKNMADSWTFNEYNKYLNHGKFKIINGKNAGSLKKYETGYLNFQPPYIKKLENIFLYHSVILTEKGGYFPDSARKWEASKSTGTFSYKSIRECHLGAGHFVLPDLTASSNFVTIEEPCMPIGMYEAYGHYLLEDLPSVWLVMQLQQNDIKLLLPATYTDIPQVLLDMLAPFGKTKKDFIIAPTKLTFMKEYYVPSKMIMLCNYANEKIIDIYKHIKIFYDSSLIGNKIYISRSSTDKRKLINESECERVFLEYGFDIISPEKYSFKDQVSIFSSATHIAGALGSGMHNDVFSMPQDNTKILYFSLYDKFQLYLTYPVLENSFCRTPSVIWGEQAHDGWWIDLKVLKKYLDTWDKE